MVVRSLSLAALTALVGGCSLVTSLSGLSGGGDQDAGGASGALDGSLAEGEAAVPETGSSPEGGATTPRLWIFGGATAVLSRTGEVWSAAIRPDGSLDAWEKRVSLPSPLDYAPAVVGNGFVALVSGNGVNPPQIVVGPIDENGLVPGWLPFGGAPDRYRHGAVVRDGLVYVVAGTTNAGDVVVGDISAATLSTSGVGTFGVKGSYPAPVAKAAVAAGTDALYLAGGDDSAGTDLAAVWRSNFGANGALDAPVSEQPLPSPRVHARAIVVGTSLLVIGGDGVAEVVRYEIGNGGALSAPTQTFALPGPRHLFGLAAYGGHLYVTGGLTTNTEPNADVLVAGIDANGKLTSGFTPGRALPAGVAYHSAAAF